MMEEICHPNNSAHPSSKLAMNRDSHLISKFKPKVRIIHIFAPEIIKTDVANFRELVQRLTGKPDEEIKSKNKKKMTRNNNPPGGKKMQKIKKNMELQIQNEEKLKMEEENEIWGSSGESSSEFLDGFADFNGFIQDFSDYNNFSLPPNSHFPHHIDVFGCMHFA